MNKKTKTVVPPNQMMIRVKHGFGAKALFQQVQSAPTLP